MSQNKTQPTTASVEQFIASIEHEGRRADAHLLLELMNKVTGAEPCMWGDSIISYGTYEYQRADKSRHRFLVTGFSPRKANMVVYLMRGVANHAPELARLGKHKHSVSCLYLPRLKNIDLDVLAKIVRTDIRLMRQTYPDLTL